MRTALRHSLLVVLVAAVGAAILAWQWWQGLEAPGPLGEARVVIIERGEGPRAITTRLDDQGVIDDPLLFLVALRLTDRGHLLQAGEYRFEPRQSAAAVIDQLAAGRTVVHRLTVPEGLTSFEISSLLDGTETLAGEAPVATEGTLLPETYHFRRGAGREEMVERMREAMRTTLGKLWPGRAEGLPFETPEEALVLASIVEKETGVAAERPLVAAVFINRLKLGMRLQSDPTVIYALTEGREPLGRELSRTDLEIDSPFNTYRHTGLPPTPIANPGRASIAAVLSPAETDDLYFVADGSGGHAFATTLDEHNRNVRRWREQLQNVE